MATRKDWIPGLRQRYTGGNSVPGTIVMTQAGSLGKPHADVTLPHPAVDSAGNSYHRLRLALVTLAG
ncbi:hypothetical protein VTN96DRAFT_6428 [Rasamsonia emersonii]